VIINFKCFEIFTLWNIVSKSRGPFCSFRIIWRTVSWCRLAAACVSNISITEIINFKCFLIFTLWNTGLKSCGPCVTRSCIICWRFVVFSVQFSVTVTKLFVDYIKSRPIVFDVFGHSQHVVPDSGSAAAATKWVMCHTCHFSHSSMPCYTCVILSQLH